MKLLSIELFNFQCHKYLKVDFGPGVTTFVGRSDSGKSSVIRALEWVMTNGTAGDDFITRGRTDCRVTLELEGHTVVREKTELKNSYILNGKRFDALGRGGVPKPVAEVLNVCEWNFQGQFDAPFWLSDSPGQVAKNLNKIVNLELIDASLDRANSELRSESDRCRRAEGVLESTLGSLSRLGWVDAASECEIRLNAVLEYQKTTAVRIADLADTVRDWKASRNAVRQAKAVQEAFAPVADKFAHLETLKNRRIALQKLVNDLKSAEVVNPGPDFAKVREAWEKGNEASERRRELEITVKEWEEAEKELTGVQSRLAKMRARLEAFPRCPACQQPLKK